MSMDTQVSVPGLPDPRPTPPPEREHEREALTENTSFIQEADFQIKSAMNQISRQT